MNKYVKYILFNLLFLSNCFAGVTYSKDYLNEIYQSAKTINIEIISERDRILNKIYTEDEKDYLINKYGIVNIDNEKEIKERVQPVNIEILLAQAILESGNGNSKYAKEGNNYLGIYTSNPEHKTITVSKNKKTAKIQKFESIYECVYRYAEIINSAKHYKEYRKIRNKTNDPYKIVEGLSAYSNDDDYYLQVKEVLYSLNKLKVN